LRALGIGIEAWGVNENLGAHTLAGTGFELQVGIDASPFTGCRLFNGATDLIKREPWVSVERQAR